MNVAGENRRAGAVAARGAGRGMSGGMNRSPKRAFGGAGAGVLLAVAGLSSPAAAQWLPNFQVYTPTRIGLFGAGYTSSSGSTDSQPLDINASGQVIGYSTPSINGQLDSFGSRDAWFFDGTTTRRIGFADGFYVSPQGRRFSLARFISANGRVAGTSSRYFSSESGGSGQDAWFFDGNTTRQIGFGGAGYILGGTRQESNLFGMNASGQVIGDSRMTNGGIDGWIFDGNTTRRIGLSGAIHVSSSGVRQAFPIAINDNGWAVGGSTRYSGGGGSEAWIFDGTESREIPLPTGGIYASTNGNRFHTARLLNSANQVAGTATRYNVAGGQVGEDAWFYDGSTTRVISLSGSAYEGANGGRNSAVFRMNNLGHVVGNQSRLGITSQVGGGNDVWFFDGSTTRQIGLTGGVYSGSSSFNSGFQSSLAVSLNNAGHVVGSSFRANASGNDVWFFDGTTTRNITPDASIYLSSTGARAASLLSGGLNEAGQAAGSIQRSGAGAGSDAWYFDLATGVTTIVDPGSQAANGARFVTPSILTQNGYLLGDYVSFMASGQAENRVFVFRPDLGFTDLGALVNGGLSSFGIQQLFTPRFANLLDALVVSGNVSSTESGLFILIPSPGVSAMVGMGLLAAWRRRR